MVEASLALGGLVGVVLSAGYLWREVGRFAAPQVPVTVFDEGKVLAAYTVGLFVGVPLAAMYLLLVASVGNGALFGSALFLGGVVAGAEVAQILLARSKYWGSTPAVPFYAVSFRAGNGGILALAAVAAYLGGAPSPAALGVAAALLTAIALVALEVAGGLLSVRHRGPSAARAGGPLAGAIFGGVAFFLLALGPVAGTAGTLVAPLVVTGGAVLAYRGRRGILAEVPPPTGVAPPPDEGRPRSYGRNVPLPSGDREPGEQR